MKSLAFFGLLLLASSTVAWEWCEVCRDTLIGFKAVVGADKNADKAYKQVLLDLCGDLPANTVLSQEQCLGYVNNYFAFVWTIAEQAVTSDVDLCYEFNACGSPAKGLKKSFIDWGPIECAACHDIFGYIDTQLLGDNVIAEAATKMEALCNILTNQDQKQQCVSMVKTYGTAMLIAVRTYLQPQTFCKLITMCSY